LRLTLLLVPPVLAIVSFFATYFFDFLDARNRVQVAALPALTLSILILLVGLYVVLFRELGKTADGTDSTLQAVKGALHIVKMGPPKKAQKYIESRLASIEGVRNTSFILDREVDRANDRFYGSVEFQSLEAKLIGWARGNVHWTDVGDQHSIELVRARHTAMSSVGKVGVHKYRLIEHSEPQINFILLTYRNGDEEVLFNWDLRNIPNDPIVLLSKDRDIVDMFAVQFANLYNAAVEDYDAKTTKSSEVI
jgi:hypothetical protein